MVFILYVERSDRSTQRKLWFVFCPQHLFLTRLFLTIKATDVYICVGFQFITRFLILLIEICHIWSYKTTFYYAPIRFCRFGKASSLEREKDRTRRNWRGGHIPAVFHALPNDVRVRQKRIILVLASWCVWCQYAIDEKFLIKSPPYSKT
jgi:hypothetical protein